MAQEKAEKQVLPGTIGGTWGMPCMPPLLTTVCHGTSQTGYHVEIMHADGPHPAALPLSQAQKAVQQAEKALAGVALEGGAGGGLEDDSTEELDPAQYFANRVKAIEAKKAKGINPYPHKFHVSVGLPEFVTKFAALEAGEQLSDVTVSLAGERVRGVWQGLACSDQTSASAL